MHQGEPYGRRDRSDAPLAILRRWLELAVLSGLLALLALSAFEAMQSRPAARSFEPLPGRDPAQPKGDGKPSARTSKLAGPGSAAIQALRHQLTTARPVGTIVQADRANRQS